MKIGQTLKFSPAPKSAACILVDVAANDSVQIIIEQPEDLEIHVSSGPKETLVDGFQFGVETVTLATPGQYRIEIQTLSPGVRVPLSSIMLRKTSALHDDASAWIEAEHLATISKRSEKPEDIDQSLRQWQVIGEPSPIARSYLKRGDALLNIGDPIGAYQTYESALTMCRAYHDLRCMGEAANNSGWASWQTGEFDESLPRYEEALDIWRKRTDKLNEGRTLSNLGLLFWQAGEFERAIDSFSRAIPILRSRDRLVYARTLNNLGLCHRSLGQYDEALALFRNAVAIELSMADAATDANIARNNLGRVLMLQGHLTRAQTVFSDTLARMGPKAGRRARALVLNNLGQTLWRRHLLDPAEARLNEALRLHQLGRDKHGTSSALHHLGLIARERGDLPRAHQLIEQAVQIRSECGLRDDAADSMAVLADLELREGNIAGAQVLAEKAVQLLESVRTNVPGPALRASFYDRRRKLLDLLVESAMSRRTPKTMIEGFLAAERGRARALLDLLAEGSLLGSISQELLRQRASCRRQIELLSLRLSTASPGREADLKNQVQILLSKTTELEARIRESIETPQFGKSLESLETLQQRVPADSAVLEYHLGEHRSHLWVVKPGDIQTFELPSRAEIDIQADAVVKRLGQAIDRRRVPAHRVAFEQALRRLSRTLLGPLEQVTLPERVILVLDGSLHRVPFAALSLPRSAGALGLTHDLIQAPSATYLCIGRKPRPVADFRYSILALTDPVFSLEDARVPAQAQLRHSGARQLELSRLPFDDDLQTIKELVPETRRRILQGFEANSGALHKLPLEEFGILHFSTHAIVDDQIPELSRVALSIVNQNGYPIDGFLYPHQLAELRLAGSRVVLSACDTGLGKLMMGEGLVGLTSSLFHAGAAQLVLSLTEVDALASAQFFSETYKRLLSRRRPTSMERACTLARKSLAGHERWRDPYYWASFIVIGRPTEAY